MNLKESFRYQNFLGSLLSSAVSSLTDVQHCLTTTKTHLRNKANEDAADVTEQVDIGEFHKNDDVLRFMLSLVDKGQKTEFMYAEVEFPSVQAAESFEPLPCFMADVTKDSSYKMKNFWKRTRG